MMSTPFTPQLTADGSFTFFSDEFGEAFHSLQGARLEAEQKFVVPTNVRDRALQGHIRLLDVCFGLGYNTAAALHTIWQVNPDCRVECIGLERSPGVPQSAIAHGLLSAWREPIPALLNQLVHQLEIDTAQFRGRLLIGDARQTLQRAPLLWADAIFLDPFSPQSCPELWTLEFLKMVVERLKPAGYLATYSCAAAVRTALLESGLQIGSTPGVGRKSPGTVASRVATGLPLSVQEREHLRTRAAIPYRDPALSATAEEIRQRRQQEQALSARESTSQWRRRWQCASSPQLPSKEGFTAQNGFGLQL
ncbi:MAG: tRNA (5-methylaminomethyl-2-thiouridine)(34)-methyltransferase MnmD [Elainellaceae cyanobacterium]